jgi:hypothetical protein
MKESKKGEIPVGLLTTTRIIQADGALASSKIFETLLRSLVREFAAAEVVYVDNGTPWVCCSLPRNRARSTPWSAQWTVYTSSIAR